VENEESQTDMKTEMELNSTNCGRAFVFCFFHIFNSINSTHPNDCPETRGNIDFSLRLLCSCAALDNYYVPFANRGVTLEERTKDHGSWREPRRQSIEMDVNERKAAAEGLVIKMRVNMNGRRRMVNREDGEKNGRCLRQIR